MDVDTLMTGIALGVLLGAVFTLVALRARLVRSDSGAPPFWGLQRLLARHEELKFHYVARSTRPDYVDVWLGDRVVYSYLWIDGEEAPPWSDLGRMHLLFRASRKSPAPQ